MMHERRQTTALCAPMVLMVAMGLAAGCATMAPPTDKQLVQNLMHQWRNALLAGDFDAVKATCAPNFNSRDFTNRDDLAQYLQRSAANGDFDNLRVDFSKAETSLTPEVGIVGPIEWTGRFGKARVELELHQYEHGAWLISGMKLRYL